MSKLQIIRFVGVVLMILIVQNAYAWQRLPLTRFSSAHAKIDFETSIKDTTDVRLLVDGKPVSSETFIVPLETIDYQRSLIVIFGRKLFSDELSVDAINLSTKQKYSISSPDWLKEFLFKKAGLLGDIIYIVAYDVRENQNFLIKLTNEANTEWQFRRICSLNFGGRYAVESKIFALPGETLDLCSENVCYRIKENDAYETYKLNPECQIIEVIKTGDRIFALVRYENGFTERYAGDPLTGRHEIVDVLSGKTLYSFDEAVYNLRIDQGELKVNRIRNSKQITDALRFDLSHLDLSGVFRFGTSNFEGRVAWSQVYFLHGLMDIAEFGQALLSPKEILSVKKRIDLEIAFLDELLNQSHDIQTKRYSINREAHRYAVQTGRILGLFARYMERHHRIPLKYVQRFAEKVYQLEEHAEFLTRLTDKDPDYELLGSVRYLRWPRGYALQYDGINIPYNHQNDWMAGILQFSSHFPKELIDTRIFVDMIHTLLKKELIDKRGLRDPVWNYTWGLAYKGWTKKDEISVNTPFYTGDKNKAHISYRTIDASAIFEVRSRLPGIIPDTVVDALKHMTQAGYLYPFLMRHIQLSDPTFCIEKKIANHYARTSNPWELPNSVWALLTLARHIHVSDDFKKNQTFAVPAR